MKNFPSRFTPSENDRSSSLSIPPYGGDSGLLPLQSAFCGTFGKERDPSPLPVIRFALIFLQHDSSCPPNPGAGFPLPSERISPQTDAVFISTPLSSINGRKQADSLNPYHGVRMYLFASLRPPPSSSR